MGKHVAPPKNKHLKAKEKQERSLPDLNERIKSVLHIDLKILGTEREERRHQRGFTAPEVLQIAASSVVMLLVWLIPTTGWLRVLTFAAAAIFAGFPVILDAAKSIINGELLESDVLITLGAVAAFCIKEYPTAIFIMIIHRVALIVEAYALSEKQHYLDGIMSVLPTEAWVETAEGIERTAPENVNVGDTLVVRPGEKIPLDGVVTEGFSSVDTSPLTAETATRTVTAGSVAVSGCINLTNTIKVRVMRPFAESTVRCALNMIGTEGKKRSDMEKQAFGAARLITPVVLLLGILLAVVPPLVSGGGWTEWIKRGILFFCLSCSAALTASVPLAFLGGLGSAARWGVFANGGVCLEKLSKAETFVFDKTGAITEGRFTITEIVPEQLSEEELLALAAAAESQSTHPIAQTLRRACKDGLPEDGSVTQIEELPGKGVKAMIGEHCVEVGNALLLDDHEVQIRIPSRNGSVIYVLVDGNYAGYIELVDKVKEGAFDAIESLRANGVTNTVMFTGDVRTVAKSVASSLNFDMVKPELTPKAKISAVEYLMVTKGSGTSLAFVCAGISDLAAMERADVGIAMGALRYGNVLNCADLSIMGDDIRRIPLALRIARAVRRTALNNILVALAAKAALLLLGALGIVSIWFAMLCELLVLCYTVFLSLKTFIL